MCSDQHHLYLASRHHSIALHLRVTSTQPGKAAEHWLALGTQRVSNFPFYFVLCFPLLSCIWEGILARCLGLEILDNEGLVLYDLIPFECARGGIQGGHIPRRLRLTAFASPLCDSIVRARTSGGQRRLRARPVQKERQDFRAARTPYVTKGSRGGSGRLALTT